ncbi:hypothetical protein [Priestia megaterium]|uniref:hypothetical protein n=1 Tax=Priestia megaterium TaxID=1404 RepID=UPI0022B93DB3|nr:hypothetical protein [Priestia megaterium]MCZ8497514.1 hypothetical protein [Priestia megaterium]
MRAEIDVSLLFKKAIKEYEEKYGKMTFSFRKEKDHFVFTSINDSLLNLLRIDRNEFVGKSLEDDISCIGHDLNRLLKEVYPLAWNGNTIVFYCIPSTNKDTLLIATLAPKFSNKKVNEVLGSCVPLSKEEFNEELITLENLKSFIIIKQEKS